MAARDHDLDRVGDEMMIRVPSLRDVWCRLTRWYYSVTPPRRFSLSPLRHAILTASQVNCMNLIRSTASRLNRGENDEYNEELDRVVLAPLRWEDRWEIIWDITERMMTLGNEIGEYELLVGETEEEVDISNVISEKADTETETPLSDFT